MVEVGTDIGGSTRYPAAYCGLYSVKGSHGRFPSHGSVSCLPGLEAVPTITAPIARTLDDLEEFWKRVVEMKPWEYDHTVSAFWSVACAVLTLPGVSVFLSLGRMPTSCQAGNGSNLVSSWTTVSVARRRIIAAADCAAHHQASYPRRRLIPVHYWKWPAPWRSRVTRSFRCGCWHCTLPRSGY